MLRAPREACLLSAACRCAKRWEHTITEVVKVGRNLWRSSCPIPLLKHGHLDPGLPRTMSRWLLNISKDGGSTTSLSNLCQCLVTCTVKKCFPMFGGNLLCFSVCTLPLVLSLGTTEKGLALSSLHPRFRYFHTLMRSPWAFSSPGCTVPALSAVPYIWGAPTP